LIYERKIDEVKLKELQDSFEYTPEWYNKMHKLCYIDNVNSPEDLKSDIEMDGDNNIERFLDIKLQGMGLELGFSNGRTLYYMSKKFPEAVFDGIDWMGSLIKIKPFIKSLCGNVNDLYTCNLNKFEQIEDKVYDFITSLDVFEHLNTDDYNACLKECYRVLKPDGMLYVYIGKPESCSHINRRPDIAAIHEICASGFWFLKRVPDNDHGLLVFRKREMEANTLISRAIEMKEPVITDMSSGVAKKTCAHVAQANVSNKILLGVTQGIGNAILTTPLIKALSRLKLKVDILEGGLIRGAEKIFIGMDNVMVIDEETASKRTYLLGLQTMWPYNGLENFVSQIRFAPNINTVWMAGILSHEVDINMCLAYTLKYEGDIPSLYCHYNPTSVESTGKKNVGIHICRRYNHQFHANRQIKDPLRLGLRLLDEGYNVFIIGHEGAVPLEEKQKFPDFVYCLGFDLPDIAGIIEQLDCVVNEDSGIMHVTAAMNTPQVALFGPTSTNKNSPWNSKAVVLQRDMPCQPCQYTKRANNCSKNICMEIDHDVVVKQVQRQIELFPRED
jgi:ADP-heptose:LPS heptosyltransferase/SAM-dependent methyltransferase